jgi:hypothetical protein
MHRRVTRVAALFGLFGLVAASGLPAAASATSQAPKVELSPGIGNIALSGNWSGYEAGSSSKITYVSAQWVVPSVKPIKGFSSTWVGIDGAIKTDPNLIQTGTEQDYTGSSFIYRAWWEIIPAPETIIPSIVVHPGDVMFGSVQDISGNTWVITLKDLSTGKSFSIRKTYKGSGHTIEWIQEAPTLGGIETLARYSTFEFSSAEAATSFGAPFDPHLQYASMAVAMSQNGHIVSSPSRPNAAGNAFRVAYGSVPPPAP